MLKSICGDIELQLQQLSGGDTAQADVAGWVLAIGREERQPDDEYRSADLVWRLAWLVYILAPSLDESLIVTMPMRLEMVCAGQMRLVQVIDDIRMAELEALPARTELATMVAFQVCPATAPARRLRRHVTTAVRALRSDPNVLDRVVEAIARDSEPELEPPFSDGDSDEMIALSLPSSRRHGLD